MCTKIRRQRQWDGKDVAEIKGRKLILQGTEITGITLTKTNMPIFLSFIVLGG